MNLRIAIMAAAVAVSARTASADVLKLYGELHGGGAYGNGVLGDLKDAAFFGQARGLTYGVLAGAKVLFLNGWIQHHQYPNGDGLKTWTQFGLGTRWSLDLGSESEGLFAELGTGLWYGVGTGAQVRPPLDRSQITDHALIAEARLGVGKHLSGIFDIALVVPLSYGYFLRSSAGSATDLSTHYIGFQAEGLIVLRANIIAL